MSQTNDPDDTPSGAGLPQPELAAAAVNYFAAAMAAAAGEMMLLLQLRIAGFCRICNAW